MKKIFVLLLATAMIFALAACGATPNGTDNNNTQDDHQAETPDASYEAPQITELYNEDFDYTDGVGNSGHYAYRVPQIEADTQGAEAINKAISDAYTPIVNGVLEDVSDKVSLSCFYVAWESYQYENILSLVVSCGWDADVNEYNVYLYDIVSGQQLTSLDGLAYQDTSSHNGHILAVPQGNALAHLKLVGRGIIKNGGSQTAKAQINRAYIGSGSLYSSLGFHIIGGIDNHHTGNGAH